MSHILLVEDEISVLNFVQQALPDHHIGFAASVGEALEYLNTHEVELVLLDLRLEHENGMEIAQHLRQLSAHTALVILTGYGSLQSAIAAIEVNAQAYLLKPIEPDELNAVVSQQLQRMREVRKRDELARHMQAAVVAAQRISADFTISSGGLLLDWKRMEGIYEGTSLNLSGAQFRLLWVLVEAGGLTVSPAELARQALEYEVNESEAADLIKGYIFQIRRKFAAAGANPEHIQTVRSRGYRWIPQ